MPTGDGTVFAEPEAGDTNSAPGPCWSPSPQSACGVPGAPWTAPPWPLGNRGVPQRPCKGSRRQGLWSPAARVRVPRGPGLSMQQRADLLDPSSEPGAARPEKGVSVSQGVQSTGSARPLLGLETETGQAELSRLHDRGPPDTGHAGWEWGATSRMSPSPLGELSAVTVPRGGGDSCQPGPGSQGPRPRRLLPWLVLIRIRSSRKPRTAALLQPVAPRVSW